VLLIETMAQTSGWLLIGMHKFNKMALLASVKEAKLRTFVTPGQVLSASARLLHDGSGFGVTRAEITFEGKPVCSAELMLRLVDFPDPSVRSALEKIAAEIAFPMESLHG